MMYSELHENLVSSENPFAIATRDVQPRHGQPWSAQEDATLRSCSRNLMTLEEIARILGRSEYAVYCRLEDSGVDPRRLPKHVTGDTKLAKKERTIVNMNHLITLLQKGYTTVDVKFSGDGSSRSQKYTYKVSDAIAKTLALGDQVVVPARGAFKVAFVVEVHAEPQIDVKAPYSLGWVVQKVDHTAYDDQVAREKEAVKMLEQAERKKAQEDALDALLGNVNREELMRLINGEPAVQKDA